MPYMQRQSRTESRRIQFHVFLSKLFPAFKKPRNTFHFYQIGTKYYIWNKGLWRNNFSTSSELLKEFLVRQYPGLYDLYNLDLQIFLASHNPTLRYVKYKVVVVGLVPVGR
jgi:hypothetical protein